MPLLNNLKKKKGFQGYGVVNSKMEVKKRLDGIAKDVVREFVLGICVYM